MLTQQLRLYCSVTDSPSVPDMSALVWERGRTETTVSNESMCVQSAFMESDTFTSEAIQEIMEWMSEWQVLSRLRDSSTLSLLLSFFKPSPKHSLPILCWRWLASEQERMLWSMNNWGEKEACKLTPSCLCLCRANPAQESTFNCSTTWVSNYTSQSPERVKDGWWWTMKHGASETFSVGFCIVWACTHLQLRVSLRLRCTYPFIPRRAPHSAALQVRVCARRKEAGGMCAGESVNEFYALLVSFKVPGEPQRKERLLPCRLDPIQFLKDVEWLQRGPALPVRWWVRLMGTADPHRRVNTPHTYNSLTMVSGECRGASRSRSLVIPPCLAAMLVYWSVYVWGRQVRG